MWKRADERAKLRKETENIIKNTRRLNEGEIGTEQEEEALAIIAAAEEVKRKREIWEKREEDITSTGGAGCLVCASCRHEFSNYTSWRSHHCRLTVPTEPGTSTYRVLTLKEEKDFKEATAFLPLSVSVKVCIAARVCVPGLFPLLFLPRSRWSTTTLGWLGKEVGAIQRTQDSYREVREDGVNLPITMSMRMRDGGLLEVSSSLLKPITCQVDIEEEVVIDSGFTSSSDEDGEDSDSDCEDEEPEDVGDWDTLVPTTDPTVTASETVSRTVTGHQENCEGRNNEANGQVRALDGGGQDQEGGDGESEVGREDSYGEGGGGGEHDDGGDGDGGDGDRGDGDRGDSDRGDGDRGDGDRGDGDGGDGDRGDGDRGDGDMGDGDREDGDSVEGDDDGGGGDDDGGGGHGGPARPLRRLLRQLWPFLHWRWMAAMTPAFFQYVSLNHFLYCSKKNT